MRAAVVHDTGGSGSVLLYVPGLDGSGELLLGTKERLAERYRVVALRYEDDGKTALEGERYALLAASIREVTREIGISRVLVLGESFGVGLSLQLALDHPDLVRALALVNGFARFDQRVRIHAGALLFPVLPRGLYEFGRRHFAVRNLFRPRRDPAAERAFLEVTRGGFDSGYGERMRMIRSLDLEPRLHEVHCPVALFASSADRVVPAVRQAKRMQALLPDATLEILPEGGHVVLPLAEEPWRERMEHLEERAG